MAPSLYVFSRSRCRLQVVLVLVVAVQALIRRRMLFLRLLVGENACISDDVGVISSLVVGGRYAGRGALVLIAAVAAVVA